MSRRARSQEKVQSLLELGEQSINATSSELTQPVRLLGQDIYIFDGAPISEGLVLWNFIQPSQASVLLSGLVIDGLTSVSNQDFWSIVLINTPDCNTIEQL